MRPPDFTEPRKCGRRHDIKMVLRARRVHRDVRRGGKDAGTVDALDHLSLRSHSFYIARFTRRYLRTHSLLVTVKVTRTPSLLRASAAQSIEDTLGERQG